MFVSAPCACQPEVQLVVFSRLIPTGSPPKRLPVRFIWGWTATDCGEASHFDFPNGRAPLDFRGLSELVFALSQKNMKSIGSIFEEGPVSFGCLAGAKYGLSTTFSREESS